MVGTWKYQPPVIALCSQRRICTYLWIFKSYTDPYFPCNLSQFHDKLHIDSPLPVISSPSTLLRNATRLRHLIFWHRALLLLTVFFCLCPIPSHCYRLNDGAEYPVPQSDNAGSRQKFRAMERMPPLGLGFKVQTQSDYEQGKASEWSKEQYLNDAAARAQPYIQEEIIYDVPPQKVVYNNRDMKYNSFGGYGSAQYSPSNYRDIVNSHINYAQPKYPPNSPSAYFPGYHLHNPYIPQYAENQRPKPWEPPRQPNQFQQGYPSASNGYNSPEYERQYLSHNFPSNQPLLPVRQVYNPPRRTHHGAVGHPSNYQEISDEDIERRIEEYREEQRKRQKERNRRPWKQEDSVGHHSRDPFQRPDSGLNLQGSAAHDEMLEGFKHFTRRRTSHGVEAFFDDIDLDNDGSITLTEFKNYLYLHEIAIPR